MDGIRTKFKRLNDLNKGLALIGIGILLGILFSHLLKGFYWGNIDLIDTSYLYKIRNADVDYDILLKYVHFKNFKAFIIFWIGCLTPIGIPFIMIACLYIGFQISFFTSVIFMKYGAKGILLILGYTIPHYIIYALVTLFCIRGGFWLHKNLYQGIHFNKKNKMKFIIVQMGFIGILGIGLVAGGYLETYVGSYLLKKVIGIF